MSSTKGTYMHQNGSMIALQWGDANLQMDSIWSRTPVTQQGK